MWGLWPLRRRARLALVGLVLSVGVPRLEPAYAAGTACGSATPGSGDYCASSVCGPCADGQGDCDPGQCAAGLECVEEGAVDHCHLVSDTCTRSTPGAGDYCAPDKCGPCGEGEGDCDPGQCASGLTCVEEGAVDHCRQVTEGCGSSPGALDYCAPDKCGPCGLGEGDCDPGQCASGLTCVEEGAVDHCRSAGTGTSNFQVWTGGAWRGVCCVSGIPVLSDRGCFWTEADRVLTDESADLELDCPEGGPTRCRCDGSGERMHGYGGADVDASLGQTNGGPIYPDYELDTCVAVDGTGRLITRWSDASCPRFRLR